jgi:hypothetical protein
VTTLNRPVRRLSRYPLGPSFGHDRGKKLAVTLHPAVGEAFESRERLELRPQGTQRPENLLLEDIYRYAISCRVTAERLKKSRK